MKKTYDVYVLLDNESMQFFDMTPGNTRELLKLIYSYSDYWVKPAITIQGYELDARGKISTKKFFTFKQAYKQLTGHVADRSNL